jgi:hypothetical protein
MEPTHISLRQIIGPQKRHTNFNIPPRKVKLIPALQKRTMLQLMIIPLSITIICSASPCSSGRTICRRIPSRGNLQCRSAFRIRIHRNQWVLAEEELAMSISSSVWKLSRSKVNVIEERATCPVALHYEKILHHCIHHVPPYPARFAAH